MKTQMLVVMFAFALLASAGFASAWHCTDTDQAKPNWNWQLNNHHGGYGVWGDNGQLGGTTSGWLANGVNKPTGCTGTQGNYVCNDYCTAVNGNLVEFYCNDYAGNSGETIIQWHTYEKAAACDPSNNVPEFNGFLPVALVTAGLVGVVIFARRN